VYDVFNVTQGDPSVVIDDVRAMRQLFPNVSLAIHWCVMCMLLRRHDVGACVGGALVGVDAHGVRACIVMSC
jgi:hypothetical protein